MKTNKFGVTPLRNLLEANTKSLVDAIENEKDNYLLKVNEEAYLEHITDKYSIKDVVIKFEEISATQQERLVPAEMFPFNISVEEGKSYEKKVIRYHIPIEGNEDLLNYMPSARILWTETINVANNEITFDIISFYDDSEELNKEADRIIQKIRQQYANLTDEVSGYNDGLRGIAKQTLETKKSNILKNNALLASLNVPIRKKEDTPQTFSIPKVRKKVRPRYKKPEVAKKGFKPEPTIDESIYKDILNQVNDIGKQFERLPSTYSDKVEETLRDHIIFILETHFEGTTTGETFNKTGKTDILIRHEGNNLFVAECKFWTGEKNYLSTIDQLLRYLTWRDSKTAIILFVRNKNFSNVTNKIKKITPSHENFIRHLNDEHETWTNWLFHIPGDSEREVRIAVMSYHIPRVNES